MILDAETTQIVRDVFIYLRSRVAIDYSEDALTSLAEHFPPDEASRIHRWKPRVQLFGFGEDAITWSDGLVLRIQRSELPQEIAAKMQPALQKFDAWAIHDRWGEFVEHPTGGLISRFFDQIWDGEYHELQKIVPSPIPLGQVFVMSRENDKRYEQTVQEMRSLLRSECLPVFHFRDGQIMFFNSNDPAKIAARRLTRQLLKLEHWAIVDSEGRTCAAGDDEELGWRYTTIDDIGFEHPED